MQPRCRAEAPSPIDMQGPLERLGSLERSSICNSLDGITDDYATGVTNQVTRPVAEIGCRSFLLERFSVCLLLSSRLVTRLVWRGRWTPLRGPSHLSRVLFPLPSSCSHGHIRYRTVETAPRYGGCHATVCHFLSFLAQLITALLYREAQMTCIQGRMAEIARWSSLVVVMIDSSLLRPFALRSPAASTITSSVYTPSSSTPPPHDRFGHPPTAPHRPALLPLFPLAHPICRRPFIQPSHQSSPSAPHSLIRSSGPIPF
jgi:hypothetical protein